MLTASKKYVLERKVDEKVFQFCFDEDASLGALYQASNDFQAFVVDQINAANKKAEQPKEECDECQEQDKESEQEV